MYVTSAGRAPLPRLLSNSPAEGDKHPCSLSSVLLVHLRRFTGTARITICRAPNLCPAKPPRCHKKIRKDPSDCGTKVLTRLANTVFFVLGFFRGCVHIFWCYVIYDLWDHYRHLVVEPEAWKPLQQLPHEFWSRKLKLIRSIWRALGCLAYLSIQHGLIF